MEEAKQLWRNKRVKTETVLQMEAVECGAASLAMILEYYGRVVSLEELRMECGVSRDGSKASNLLRAARKYGLSAKGFRLEPAELREYPLPMVVFWNFNHFLILEGIKRGKVYLNDPAMGHRMVSEEEFDESFTGVALIFEPTPEFTRGGARPSLFKALRQRLRGSGGAVAHVGLAGLFLVVPGLVIPTFSKVFMDDILVGGMSDWIRPLLLAMGVTALLRMGLTKLQQRYLLRLETKLALASSAQFFRHIFRLPMNFFEQRYGGEIGNRVQTNDKVAQLLSGDLANNALNLLQVIFFAAVMLQYDVVLTLIGGASVTLNLVCLRMISRKRTNLNQKLLQEQAKLMGTTMGGLQAIETLKATGSESDFFAQWSGHQAKALNAQQEMGLSTLFLSAIPVLLTTLNTISILALGGLRVMEGYLSIGALIAFQSLMSSFMGPVQELMNLGGKLQEAEGDMGRLNDVLKNPVDSQFAGEAASGPKGDGERAKLDGYLDLVGVTFGYNRLEPPLIEDFNLSLKPG
ncbi:MAG: cysteine peptidase family C39 domain-containing protein, partial [Acidobacteriota bacterium]